LRALQVLRAEQALERIQKAKHERQDHTEVKVSQWMPAHHVGGGAGLKPDAA
jgi:hypothetical protein